MIGWNGGSLLEQVDDVQMDRGSVGMGMGGLCVCGGGTLMVPVTCEHGGVALRRTP